MMTHFNMSVSQIAELVDLLESDARRWYHYMICTKQVLFSIESYTYDEALDRFEELIAELKLHQGGVINESQLSQLAIVYIEAHFAFTQYLTARRELVAQMLKPVTYSLMPVVSILGTMQLAQVPIYNYDPEGEWLVEFNNSISYELQQWNRIHQLIGEVPEILQRNREFSESPFIMSAPRHKPSPIFLQIWGIEAFGQSFPHIEDDFFVLLESTNPRVAIKKEVLWQKVQKLKWYQQAAFCQAFLGVDVKKLNDKQRAEMLKKFLAVLPPWAKLWENRAPKFLCKLNLQRQNERCVTPARIKPPRFCTGHGAKSNKRK